MAPAPTTRLDAVLAESGDVARAALDGVAEPGTVGEHLGVEMLGDRLAMHWFACTATGYRGWRWGVSLARVPRARVATVCETNLLPGPDSVLAPEWLPYAQRLAPGDVGAGDVLPYKDEDPYLEPGFEATGEEDVDRVALWELGLGRPRVLSAEGREAAATRWYAGDGGPTSDVAQKATDRCATCGFFVPMSGALRAVFGVCANEWSPSDGRVVSLDHGCGAHSETDVQQQPVAPVGEPIVDEFAVDLEGKPDVEQQADAQQAADAAPEPPADLTDEAKAGSADGDDAKGDPAEGGPAEGGPAEGA